MPFDLAEARLSESPLIEKIWHIRSTQAEAFTSISASHSELVITRYKGQTMISVRGPETKSTPAVVPDDVECLGIVFKLGTFMPTLPPATLLDRNDACLPVTSNKTFWLDSAVWEIPNFENADVFVARLVREGLLVHDPVVSAALQGQPQAYSPRALQYRFLRATGLTQNKIHQIERARRAAALLANGMPIFDTAYELGYFDQSHMTNALKRFIGKTPTQIAPMWQLA